MHWLATNHGALSQRPLSSVILDIQVRDYSCWNVGSIRRQAQDAHCIGAVPVARLRRALA